MADMQLTDGGHTDAQDFGLEIHPKVTSRMSGTDPIGVLAPWSAEPLIMAGIDRSWVQLLAPHFRDQIGRFRKTHPKHPDLDQADTSKLSLTNDGFRRTPAWRCRRG